MSLLESLEKLQTEGQPQITTTATTLEDTFSDNEQAILYEKLTASLRKAAFEIKEQMKSELESMAENLSQEIVSKLKDSPVYNKLMAGVEETAMGMKDKMRVEIEPIIFREVKETISKIPMPNDGKDGRDGKNAVSPDPKEIAKLIAATLPKSADIKDAVVNEEKIISEVLKKIPQIRPSSKRGGGGSTVIMEDLTAQVNGSTKVFITAKKIGTPLLVASTQFPQILRPTIDYTTSNITLTLTSEVGTPEINQTLIIIYVEG